jgi:hypothetical protein
MASEYVFDTVAVAITSLFAQWNCFEGNVANLLCYFAKVFPGKF